MIKIGIPIVKNKVGSSFEQCSEFLLFTIENRKKVKKEILNSHLQAGMNPYWLAESGVTDIIVKRISEGTINKFNTFKINVFTGVETTNPDQLVKEFLNGSMETNTISEENNHL